MKNELCVFLTGAKSRMYQVHENYPDRTYPVIHVPLLNSLSAGSLGKDHGIRQYLF